MAAKETIKTFCKSGRPVMSTNAIEAKRHVRALYKAFYRYIPYIIKYFDIPKNELDCRCKLREQFYKNACVTDLRIIDILVIKGFMELKEITHQWQQKGHLMANWHPSAEPKPTGFIGKFLAGLD